MQLDDVQHHYATEAVRGALDTVLNAHMGDSEDALVILDRMWADWALSARLTAEREGNILAADIVGLSPQQMIKALSFLIGDAGAEAVMDAIQYAKSPGVEAA